MARTFKIFRNLAICSGLKSCGECVKYFPAMETDGLLISAENMQRHEREIEEVIRQCQTGAVEIKEL